MHRLTFAYSACASGKALPDRARCNIAEWLLFLLQIVHLTDIVLLLLIRCQRWIYWDCFEIFDTVI